MKNVLTKIKKFAKQVRGLFPSSLPTGLTAYNEWADDIAETYFMPTQDKDSIRFSLASIVMHLGPTAAYRSKFYFALVLRAGAAKQVAGAAFYDIKTKQQEAAKAAEAARSENDSNR